MHRKPLAITTLFFAAVILVGCAAQVRDLSTVSYVQPPFSPESLRMDGLAILPVVAGAGQEAFRRPMADHITGLAREAMNGGHLVSWKESMMIINGAELADEYQQAISIYSTTSILDQKFLDELASVISTRYLLFTSLQQLSVFSTFPTVGAYCQVWDLDTRDIVWEGTAKSDVIGSGYSAALVSYDELTLAASHGLIKNLFKLHTTDETELKSGTKAARKTDSRR